MLSLIPLVLGSTARAEPSVVTVVGTVTNLNRDDADPVQVGDVLVAGEGATIVFEDVWPSDQPGVECKRVVVFSDGETFEVPPAEPDLPCPPDAERVEGPPSAPPSFVERQTSATALPEPSPPAYVEPPRNASASDSYRVLTVARLETFLAAGLFVGWPDVEGPRLGGGVQVGSTGRVGRGTVGLGSDSLVQFGAGSTGCCRLRLRFAPGVHANLRPLDVGVNAGIERTWMPDGNSFTTVPLGGTLAFGDRRTVRFRLLGGADLVVSEARDVRRWVPSARAHLVVRKLLAGVEWRREPTGDLWFVSLGASRVRGGTL